MDIRKKRWVLLLPLVAVLFTNIGLLPFFAWLSHGGTAETIGGVIFVIGIVLIFALGVVAIVVHAVPKLRNPRRERQTLLIIKLGLAPFFIVGGFTIVLAAMSAVGAFIGLVELVVGYIVVLSGSMWGFVYILSLRKAQALKPLGAMILALMQFFFVLDVVAALILFFKGMLYERSIRKQLKSNSVESASKP